MSVCELLTVVENRKIGKDVYKMVLCGDSSAITAPGQFINIKLDGLYLRRPISIFDWEEGKITIVYKVVGKGTEQMAEYAPGKVLDVLVGLGNGFAPEACKGRALLIGGGVGVPPLYGLAKALIAQGTQVSVVMGFNGRDDVILKEKFEELGVPVTVTTADGSVGTKGFVTNAMPGMQYDFFYTCGPEPMLRAVYQATETSGQFSFEERMGCGFGACMGCSCKTKYGNKRICKDGPVLVKEEIIW